MENGLKSWYCFLTLPASALYNDLLYINIIYVHASVCGRPQTRKKISPRQVYSFSIFPSTKVGLGATAFMLQHLCLFTDQLLLQHRKDILALDHFSTVLCTNGDYTG